MTTKVKFLFLALCSSPSALLISVQFVLKDMKPDKKSIEGNGKTLIYSMSFE